MIHPLILSGILLYISGAAGVNIAVKSGSSGIIPCVYDKQYKENRKYLCKGTVWSSCRILAYANETGKYSITDYPDQSIFTVRWDRLETSDSGKYWCAVEIGDYNTIDAGYYLYLTVKSAPDVSVVSSSVSGHEGGNVSVQCFYSSRYQNHPKQWCRYKDQRCYTVGRTDTSQSSSVQISDDGRRSFTVLMTGLRLSDSGWFFCSAGDLQVPVQLFVQRDNKSKNTRTLSMKTLGHVTVREGETVTIPCLYDSQYKLNPKYWCKGSPWISCTITARVNDTGKWTITDYPAQNIFTVKLNNSASSDSGYYWCAVEIGTYTNPDDKKRLYLTVKQAPDVSVVSSSVSGHEGGNVSVQCFYSSGYQNKLKQWCRYKDQRCYTVGRTDTSQNPSVQISDDGRSSFTVLMTGLRLSDSGWYWCSAGDLQVPVQLFVQRDNKYKNTTESDKSSDDADPSSSIRENHQTSNDTEVTSSEHRDGIFLLLWTAVPLLLLLMLVLVIWRIIQKCNLPTQGPDVCSETETTVMYEVFKKVKEQQSRPPDQDEVIYRAVKHH
ncbi:polymeric immunoglobulin receptor-like isoform X4 [Megalobrama amblycephala]|uniref:polymeric immunoglobulin receptor-like isoform X4 n=1 Tax=Megalobrama amblycephala TaxID=75352 RepID=UPI0020145D06|nr:polymeric immunoglobulin receptor-like isoform X4 [Megalobrama amblycephala]